MFYHHTRLPDENFNPASHGGISYAFVIDQNEQAVHVGVSVCSLKDNFNKKFGRTTAEDRLKAYLNGTPVLTAKDDTGLQYPMAFSVGVQDVVSVLHVEGVPQNYKVAYILLNLAASQGGDSGVINSAIELRNNILNSKKITPTDIEDAQSISTRLYNSKNFAAELRELLNSQK